MRTNYRTALVTNLITLIIIFVLLTLFDRSGDNHRNTILALVWFVLMLTMDFATIWRRNQKMRK